MGDGPIFLKTFALFNDVLSNEHTFSQIHLAPGMIVSVLRIRITLMRFRIRILLVTSMRIRIRILPITLKHIRIPIRTLVSKERLKSQNLEKVLKLTHIQYILACHLQTDAVPDPDLASACPLIRLRIRILPLNLTRIRIQNTGCILCFCYIFDSFFTQVVIGTAKLVATPKYFPLRFHCCQILSSLSATTGIHAFILGSLRTFFAAFAHFSVIHSFLIFCHLIC
jgi:hypothetical protein